MQADHPTATEEQSESLAFLEKCLHRPWGPVRFPARLERTYQEYHRRRWLLQTRLSMLVGIVLFAGYAVLDYFLFPGRHQLVWVLRLLVACPLGLVLFGYTFVAERDTQLQVAYTAFLVLAGWSVAAIVAALPQDSWHIYGTGVMLVIAFGYIVATLRLPYALAAGLLNSIGYLLTLLLLRDPAGLTFMTTAAGLLSINLIGAYGALVMETYMRREFARVTLGRIDRRKLAATNVKLASLSTRDHLTGVANRRALERFLTEAWKTAAGSSMPVSALMLDLDRFKRFNDRHGHQAGDLCLSEVARCLQPLVRNPDDLLARYGGEEFVIVLAGTDSADAAAVAERVRAEVEDMRIEAPHEDRQLAITVSVGVATRWPTQGNHPSELIRAADMALYRAKRAGRNRVVMSG